MVEKLAGRVLDLTTDPIVKIETRRASGWALAWTNRHAAALAVLISVAKEKYANGPVPAWSALSLAATVAFLMVTDRQGAR
ncbi:MAG: hypothetical protein ACR2IK_03915 [Chloroflexota bacterium]